MARMWKRLPWSRRVALLLMAAGLFLLFQTFVSSGGRRRGHEVPWTHEAPAHDAHARAEKSIAAERESDKAAATAPTHTPPAETKRPASTAAAAATPGTGHKADTDCTDATGACGAGEIKYRLATGDRPPVACVNGVSLFDKAKIVNGYNLVVINGHTSEVDSVRYFDTAKNDHELVGFIYGLPEDRAVMLVSSGTIADRFSAELREALLQLGAAAEKVTEMQGDTDDAADPLNQPTKAANESTFSIILVGQRGASGGAALLRIVTDDSRNNELSGCLRLPLPAPAPAGQLIRRENVVFGDILPHCGLRDACQPNQMAVSVYSGRNKDDQPKMCIDGRMVMARNLNQGGRGLNVAVLNATNKDVLRVAHFDTYAEDSSTLEIFLEQMVDREMIIIVSFDEASTKLSSLAKEMLYELGSGLAQNIKFRASWYFIGQKGITGFSPFEELNYAHNNEWAKPVDKRLCIPAKLDGLKAHVDAPARQENEARRQFCTKYDGYEEFCDDEHVDEVLTPAPLLNKADGDGAVYTSVPILVVAGLSHNSLRLTLETLLRQPGLSQNNVMVAYDENYEECSALSSLFGFTSVATNASASYMDQFALGIDGLVAKFPKAEEFIIIEEELLLTADFLHYMGQLLPALRADRGILAVSAWNDNGFTSTSGDENAVYRVQGVTALLGFMISKEKLVKHFIGRSQSERVWDGWTLGGDKEVFEILIPDTSRVVRRPTDGLAVLKPGVDALLRRQRAYIKRHGILLESVSALQPSQAYDKHLRALLQPAAAIGVGVKGAEPLAACVKMPLRTERKSVDLTELSAANPGASSAKNALVFYANSGEATSKLAACLGLYHTNDGQLRGVYKGIIRFSWSKRPCLLVSGDSREFFPLKAANVVPFS